MILILLLLLLDVKGFSFQSMLCQDEYLGEKREVFLWRTPYKDTNINNVMTGDFGVQNYTILGLDLDVFLFVLNSWFSVGVLITQIMRNRGKNVFKRQDKAIIDGYRIRQKERQPFFRISIFLCLSVGRRFWTWKDFDFYIFLIMMDSFGFHQRLRWPSKGRKGP